MSIIASAVLASPVPAMAGIQSFVDEPDIDVENAVLTAFNRTYPGETDSVPVKDLYDTHPGNKTYVFENQVTGPTRGGNVFPSLYKSPGPNGNALSFVVPPTGNRKARTEFFFEGARLPQTGAGSWTRPTNSNRVPWEEGRWIAFALYLPTIPGNDNENLGPGIITQWYDYSPANPPMSLTYSSSGGKPALTLVVDTDPSNGGLGSAGEMEDRNDGTRCLVRCGVRIQNGSQQPERICEMLFP